jgi:hypothetical protein
VLRVDTGLVTHSFNPFTYQPRHEADLSHMHGGGDASRTLAWSGDGRILYKLMGNRHARADADPDDTSTEHAVVLPEASGLDEDEHGGGVWASAVLLDEAACALPSRKVVYALDVSTSSALRCTHGRGGCASEANLAPPFCLDWQVRRCTGELKAAASCERACVCVRTRLEASSTGCEEGGERGAGLGLPGELESGVAMMRVDASADVPASLVMDPVSHTLRLCSVDNVHATWVA